MESKKPIHNVKQHSAIDTFYVNHIRGTASRKIDAFRTELDFSKFNFGFSALKSYDEIGLVFYTNSNSKKGKSIKENNNVALNFHWKTQNRQIRIEGIANIVSKEVADSYFKTRPRNSQIGAWSSNQSDDLSSRDE